MTWDQIKSLNDESLATIGSHSHSHLDLRYASKEKIISDINKAKNLLQQKANITPRHFCYPYGNPQKREIDIIKSLNFKTATTAYPGNIYSRHIDNLFNLPRFFVAEFLRRISCDLQFLVSVPSAAILAVDWPRPVRMSRSSRGEII